MIRGAETITFSFDGQQMRGATGDTLAAALLANGVRLVGRSFKYHRPRGIFSAGVEEPNALVEVGVGGRFEPNTRATDVFIYEGLVAFSQNRWPSLKFDLGAVNQMLAPLIPAGFYYKTFLGPPKLWKFYEHFIRRAAGLGKPPTVPEVDAFEHRAAFCDVLVVGGGPAGLEAAVSAARAGERVILVEQDARFGGTLLRDREPICGQEAEAWISASLKVLNDSEARVLSRTTAIGYHDHNLVTLAQHLVEPGQVPASGTAAQRLWRVRAGRVILATGAIERPLVFAGNDRPGVMLASAVRTYVNRFGVLPGRNVVIATAHDDAYRTALDLADAGARSVMVLDTRPASAAKGSIVELALARLEVHFDAQVIATRGRSAGLRRVEAQIGGKRRAFAADLLAVCGGFTPTVHLHMQAGGQLLWSEDIGAFVPAAARQAHISVGAAAGEGLGVGAALYPSAGVNLKQAFIDQQNDVTAADLKLAWREGYRSIEHLKRYTTVGMATDQGKTSNILALAALARAEGRPIGDVGVTTFRQPYTPVTLGALAGPAVGAHVAPTRCLLLHDLHAEQAPTWQPSGYWQRPGVFARPAETVAQAAIREARTVRTAVGLTDVSTLAKFEIAGPDAAALLEVVCATSVRKLKVGRGRYTFMLREDGLVFDDGTVWRLEEQRFLLTSSTGGADRMDAHLAYARCVLAPSLKAAIANVQEHWAALALAGPKAAETLESLTGVAPPAHMAAASAQIAGVPVRVLAASYSGERAFEIYVQSGQTSHRVWQGLATAVRDASGCAYGLDAMDLLRIEKGHLVVGAEIDGRLTARDLGLGGMLRPGSGFVGASGLTRSALDDPNRLALVGLESLGGPILEGAMLTANKSGLPQGHVTSAGVRILGEGAVALGLLQAGRDRLGETLMANSPTRGCLTQVRVTSPVFYDPQGLAYRG